MNADDPKCDGIQDWILESVDQPLDADRLRALKSHLQGCPGCRAFQSIQDALETTLPQTLAPRVLPASVKANLLLIGTQASTPSPATAVSVRREFWNHVLTQSLPRGLNLLAYVLTALVLLWLALDLLLREAWQPATWTSQGSNPGLIAILSVGAIAAGMVLAFYNTLRTHRSLRVLM